jgi:glycosyltransferase involved in cell wall biosynthesis
MAPVGGAGQAEPARRIVHLITGLHPGGAENQLRQLVLASGPGRFRHVVVSLQEGGSIASELKASDIEVYSLKMKRGLPSPLAMVRLVRLLRRLRPDVLHCWLYHACLMGVAAGRLAGVPRVVWGLRSANPSLCGYSASTRAVVRFCAVLSALADTLTVNSQASRKVHQNWGYAAAGMRVIPNGTDVQRFVPDAGARASVRAELGLSRDSVLVGLFARYTSMKDHATFLRAAKLVQPRHPRVRFLMAGDGITRDNGSLARLLQENSMEQAVYLLGARRDLPRLTAALDVSCLSSWSESFPNVVVEAMACAVPCVVTDAGDTRFIVGDVGFVVPPSNSQALADAIGAVLDMPAAERGALGHRLRERVLAEFSLQKMVTAYHEVYEESQRKSASQAREATRGTVVM